MPAQVGQLDPCREVSKLRAYTHAFRTEKTALYFAAGAHEVWLVGLDGGIRFFGPEGVRTLSQFADFPARIELPCLRRH